MRAILTSPDMNRPNAGFKLLRILWWKASSSLVPSSENANLCLIFLLASSIKFLSTMSPMCSRLMENAMISMAPALFFIGLIAFNRGRRTFVRDLGRVAIGLGLMVPQRHHARVRRRFATHLGICTAKSLYRFSGRRRRDGRASEQHRDRFARRIVCCQRLHQPGGGARHYARCQCRHHADCPGSSHLTSQAWPQRYFSLV